ncbi:MAG TPA: hypothetical protein VJB99_03060 [Patescibacteria group bacterium]|nr:hypothetical protein [Patescibacteria group bacterium]
MEGERNDEELAFKEKVAAWQKMLDERRSKAAGTPDFDKTPKELLWDCAGYPYDGDGAARAPTEEFERILKELH